MQKNLIEEIKKYFLYLNELGLNALPVDEKIKKFLKNENFAAADSIESLKNALLKCEKCPLHRVRKQPIWGEGNINSPLMLITEYPDKDEDFYGRPFVGQLEGLLKRMLLAINLRKEDFFITHAVKCKTPGGRPPEPEEIEACKTYLFRQIKYIKPKLILALGFTPPKVFLENKFTFSSIRGKLFKIKGNIPILFTYHPNYMLKNPAIKRLVWEDLQTFRRLYEEIFKGS